MYDVYIKEIRTEEVRHLKDVVISISKDVRKHLILTGKNGSGKTSLLEALSCHLNYLASKGDLAQIQREIENWESEYKRRKDNNLSENEITQASREAEIRKKKIDEAKAGLSLDLNVPSDGLKTHFEEGEYILAYYTAARKFTVEIPKHVEKIELKPNYGITESPRNLFVKYILDLKMTEALAWTSGKTDRAKKIRDWFDHFDELLKQIFDDDSLKLEFDEDTFAFSLHQDGKEAFDFQKLSDGFAAILDIVVDLMVRMEKHLNGGLRFDLPGIVLIDEIETHLHLELQKKVLDFLMNVFPNLQFIVSTHSPFVLSSAKNAVIFDMENRTLVKNGLTGLPYDGVVRGYFEVDSLSAELREKFERYKLLANKKTINDDEMEEIANIEMYLDEIPDYLALEITTEYRRLKNEFAKREVF